MYKVLMILIAAAIFFEDVKSSSRNEKLLKDFKIKSINWKPVKGSEAMSGRKHQNLVSFLAERVKTRTTKKRNSVSTTEPSLATEPARIEENFGSSESVAEISQNCNQAIISSSNEEMLNILQSNTQKLEASTSQLGEKVNENSDKLEDITSKLEEINDQLHNIFEVLTQLLSLSDMRKKIELPINDSESFKLQVNRSPRDNSTDSLKSR